MSRKKLPTLDFSGKQMTRRERRRMTRFMDAQYALKAYEVTVYDDSDKFWVIAINDVHVEELLLACPEAISPKDIDSIIHMNPEQMKLITINPNDDDDSELPITTLFEVFTNYAGSGEIICSTMWAD